MMYSEGVGYLAGGTRLQFDCVGEVTASSKENKFANISARGFSCAGDSSADDNETMMEDGQIINSY